MCSRGWLAVFGASMLLAACESRAPCPSERCPCSEALGCRCDGESCGGDCPDDDMCTYTCEDGADCNVRALRRKWGRGSRELNHA